MYRVDVEVDAVENLPNHRKLFPFVNVLLKLLNAIIHPPCKLGRHSWPFTEKENVSISKTFTTYKKS